MAPTLMSREKRIEQMRGFFDSNADDLVVRKLEKQWERNLLVGVFLHAAARRSKGIYNSIFERHILEIVKTIGVDDGEILEYGKMYEAHREKMKVDSKTVDSETVDSETVDSETVDSETVDSDTVASAETARILVEFLPGNVENHPVENVYTEEDFLRHVKELTTVMVAMDECRIVDVSKISEDNNEWLTDNDSAVTVFTGPSLTAAGDAAQLDRNGYKVVLSKFKVAYRPSTEGRGETFWLTTAGSDVEYKALADGSRGYALDFSQSQSFKTNTEGQVHSLEDEVLYDGKVNKSLACHLMCWEADNTSDEFNKLVKLLIVEEGKELISAAVKAADQSAETLLALAATVTGFQNFLLALAASEKELDFIAERTVAFTKEGLDALLTRNELKFYFDTQKRGGRNVLYIRRVLGAA